MDVKTQTIEQYLFEQLEKIAPGKYTLANVLEFFKSKLRFTCNHLKGGGHHSARVKSGYKDYNFSTYRFADGVTEIRCLYNCGLKVRSDNEDLKKAFSELANLPTSNTQASSECILRSVNGKRVPVDPGPTPTYTDAQRARIRESGEMSLKTLAVLADRGQIKPGDPILGGTFPHPDPVEAPDTIVERGIKRAHLGNRIKKVAKTVIEKATVTFQDKIPALEPKAGPEPVKKIRKSKTQSRRKRSGK